MEWQENTIHNLEKLFNNKNFKEWSDAVEEGQINQFSDELTDLTDRLSRLLAVELECDDRAKIEKILELAVLAGKVL